MQIENWSNDPRVAPLLEAMRETPPTKHWYDAPSISSLFGRDRVFSYVHPALGELKAIHNEYFKKLDPIDKEQGFESYRAAAWDFLDNYPTPEQFAEQAFEQSVRLAA